MSSRSAGRSVIICCAVTGSGDTTKKSSAVPITPAQIAQSAIDAAKAGAAIVHLHVRDPETGAPSMKLEYYKEATERIRSSGIDVILNLTTGAGARFVPGSSIAREAGPGTTLVGPDERVSHVLSLKPEICSLDIGSMNMGEHAFINTPPHLRAMAKAVNALGVTPELEVFEAGHVMLARSMIERGDLQLPSLFQICLGVPWGQPASSDAMIYMQTLLPKDSNWFSFGVGQWQFPMVAQSVLLGGHVRVGLEDNLYIERGTLAPDNASLVEKAAKIIRLLGCDVAEPTEARVMLGLRN